MLRKHQLFPAIYNHLIQRSAGNTHTRTQPARYSSLLLLLFLGGGIFPFPLREEGMEYFVVPTQKVSSFQEFRKSEKEVIGGLCRCVLFYLPLCVIF